MVLSFTALAGCRSFEPLSPEVAGVLGQRSEHEPPTRRRAQVELEGMLLAGVYEAVLLSSGGATPDLRLQLFPDVGGKLVDLVVGPRSVAVWIAPQGWFLSHPRSSVGPERLMLMTWVGSLLETVTPITPGRVRGQRAVDGGYELLLEPAVPGMRVVARIDAEGRLLERAYAHGGERWREAIEPEQRVFSSAGFFQGRWYLREESSEAIEPPPSELFELPAELREPEAAIRP